MYGNNNYYSCLVCESKGNSIPTGTKLMMKQCGIGYKEISDFILDDDGNGLTYEYIPKNSSVGQNLKICEKL